ncbi:thioredoxin domain-containing protein 11 [Belonocnema kinseyi]|uniref:thioredoxin domain-containing protein 11 n=1 Tax=Belonocnema kinseyi TaxID=2817044 RepID=UPI00143DB31F|nr:thioredoxin domain-containing protein 11 [Belonocnema kinseyi]
MGATTECDSSSEKSSDSSSLDSGSANESKQGLASKMFSYANSIFFVGIIFTILVALQSSPPKISKPPPARPFFNTSSIVADFYKGHLSAMVERIMDSDFSFIMYYAPWDAESQALRVEFEIVSQYYHSQIFFAAINCWHPGSECRSQYNKIQSYPVLMLYPSRHSGVQYKGIRTAPYMMQFLDAVMSPIVRITNNQQLVNLLLENDAVVVGFFNFTGVAKSPGYKEFYQAAIRSLERDPNREIIYAAVTDPKTAESNYGVVTFPHARLFLWNESLSWPESQIWTTDALTNWAGKEMHRVTLWLQPPGSKSLTFAPYLWDGPALFLFTPRNPLHSENYNYNLLKELALQYYNCADNYPAIELVKGLREKRLRAIMNRQNKIKYCTRLLSDGKIRNRILVSVEQWINDTCCAKIVMNKCVRCKRKITVEEANESVCKIPLKEFNQVCLEKDVFSLPSKLKHQTDYESCCDYGKDSQNRDQEFHSDKFDESDPYSADAVQQFFYKEKCEKLLTGNKYHRAIFPRDYEKDPSINLTPAICEVNKTLSFIAVDSLYFYHYAEGLGVDVLNRRDKTAAVILDPNEDRSPKICLMEEIRGCINGNPSAWGKELVAPLEEVGDGETLGMIWEGRDLEDVSRNLGRGVLRKMEQDFAVDTKKVLAGSPFFLVPEEPIFTNLPFYVARPHCFPLSCFFLSYIDDPLLYLKLSVSQVVRNPDASPSEFGFSSHYGHFLFPRMQVHQKLSIVKPDSFDLCCYSNCPFKGRFYFSLYIPPGWSESSDYNMTFSVPSFISRSTSFFVSFLGIPALLLDQLICGLSLTRLQTFLLSLLEETSMHITHLGDVNPPVPQDVVVMYHSPYCAFCSAVAYVYLSVAHYLSKMDHLVFVRVDGDNNDLPWEYSMDRYPSILYFPGRRKEDSTVFPFSLPITIANLLNFVLANLEGDSHVEALVNICQVGSGESPKDCVFRIRWLCLDIIEDLLREYRKLRRHESLLGKRVASDRRRLILLKLEVVKSVFLILETTNDLSKDELKVNLIREKFKIYYRTMSSLDGNIRKVTIRPKSNLVKDEL